jgi:alkanesulfonate monooxygenase SsuD/methylene tetrahydromethanopterin reductase-like flavin-dependent oxidoreductase (luciferase family)
MPSPPQFDGLCCSTGNGGSPPVPAVLGQRGDDPLHRAIRHRPGDPDGLPPDFQRLCRMYQEVAAGAGRTLRLGESVGVVRALHFGRTEEEAVALLRDTNYTGFCNYFGGFGFWEAFRMPEDAAKYPDGVMPPTSEWTVERMRTAKYALAGTPDQVKAEFEALKRIGGAGELEWFGWFFDQDFMPWEEEMRPMELFAEHIIPAFR